MKCPFCGEEMKCGYLQSGRPFFWSEEKSSLFFMAGQNDVAVSEGFWNGCYAESDYCPNCKKIITSVSDKE